jgi:translation initiation factor IF-1
MRKSLISCPDLNVQGCIPFPKYQKGKRISILKKIETYLKNTKERNTTIKMVKNTGGNKTKGQARKFVTAKPSTMMRISQDEYEIYAQVIKILGGSMCHVVDSMGVTRLCHIRGKFRGRGKRDNFLVHGSWILVGLREWETGKESIKGKLENCDLLEVYSELDKDRLKNTVTHINWCPFVSNDTKMTLSTKESEDGIVFSDERTEEYRQLIEHQITHSESKGSSTMVEEEEEINIDDI